ncbi:MAG TPA: HNH endonuclease signature motif containing protein [Phycisphaerae bacterium]|nr:HNH endonuclease signature motif containing protein [Phycisphaerae bacterium]
MSLNENMAKRLPASGSGILNRLPENTIFMRPKLILHERSAMTLRLQKRRHRNRSRNRSSMQQNRLAAARKPIVTNYKIAGIYRMILQHAKRCNWQDYPRRGTKQELRRDISMGLRFAILKRDRFRCRLCGNSPAIDANCHLHVDHIRPFSKGGKTRAENLRALCAHCNIGKGNRETI